MRRGVKITIALGAAILCAPLILAAIGFVVGVCLYLSADFNKPTTPVDLSKYELSVDTDSLRVCGDSWLMLNRSGLWEAYIEGNSFELGAKYGVMSSDLLERQEDVFVNQIHEMIPSEWWVDFLHKLIIIFNRNIADYIPEQYCEEIYAMSLSCTDKYNSYGNPYVRQLNYHAAHDIGHAMQQYMLVGCSSFACWGAESDAQGLLVGRNFDFWVGDDFAKNKVVLFVEPEDGYRFASISWPGMMGVLSGMNECGLTVTLNAAKGAIPTSSAIPISLLARHILQYASNIDEAYNIASQYKTFVSESLLIGSAKDGCAAIIEKTPDKMALYRGSDSSIICTNHYQSSLFAEDEYNVENIATSDSPYRYQRLEELLTQASPVSVDEAVGVLRNRYGLGGADIGLSNEKSLNQFIAHHSIVFEPEKLRFWVSTSPWQLGEYLCYDLNDVFDREHTVKESCARYEYSIAADSLALDDEYVRVCRYREHYRTITSAIDSGEALSQEFIEEVVANNPNYFQVYNTLGDYEFSRGNVAEAVAYWQRALTLEMPRTTDYEAVKSKIQKYDKR